MKRVPVIIFATLPFFSGRSASPGQLPNSDYWLNVFPPYPGATYVCSQHVSGNSMHINWTLYTTRDTPEKVLAFYREKLKFSDLEVRKDGEFIWQESSRRTLHAVHVKSAHPGCGTEPPAGTQTVFVVSQATGR